MSHRIAFQMDALQKLNMPWDTTLSLAQVAAQRGYELFHYEPRHLRMDLDGKTLRVTAHGHELVLDEKAPQPWRLGKKSIQDLSGFDVLLIRQDPPFDLAYITSTHILEHVHPKIRLVNDPVGIRNAPEKLLMTYFPHLMPPTLITREMEAIQAFRAKYKDIIVKPLYSHGGRGVFHLRQDDDNLPGLIELMTSINQEPWIIQKYLPVTELGDKRIVLFDGDPAGAFLRLPMAGDVRSNLRVEGARSEACSLTDRDREICATLKPMLRERGLYFVGLDVIGDYLTEINVTSPSGIVDIDLLDKRSGKDRTAEQFWSKLDL